MKCGKIIGVGNTATVYEWEEGKVLKLFYEGYPKKSVEKEFHNAMAIRNMNFAKPKAYEIISCKERMGIIYDRVEGESLLDWVIKTGDVEKCAVYMAKLHKAILQNSINNVPHYKDFLKLHIPKEPSVNLNKEEVLQRIDKLPDGSALCHGDFHPGNILISNGHAIVIDFMNLCHGDFLYDVARTVFLIEYTPVPVELEHREMLLEFKKTLADLYLMQMNVTRERIQDYLTVIITVRKGECPNEELNIR
ncbi:aminoglycoside phosphotransferase family protein [Clostridium amazonitimonense]|uniref:aminoglycoside phosphotransferase family protein n=1 Tax=Clostridium amazonitimonense TaxID=1499689 RepID=UPI000509DCF9|nr:aminoglycoside phosphotransferase family protein [Clostridium amazonitimonense]